jgi:hypothetical protein
MTTSCLGEAERTCFDALQQSSGFRFSMSVQHAWCARRAVNEGLLTLSVLRDDVRLRLLGAWMSSRDTLLDFIARELPDPSAELAVCRFEQLIQLANSCAPAFTSSPRPVFDAQRSLRRTLHAGLVTFRDEPALLVAPGFRALCRVATTHEKLLWARLATPVKAAVLLEQGFPRGAIEGLLRVGALDYVC